MKTQKFWMPVDFIPEEDRSKINTTNECIEIDIPCICAKCEHNLKIVHEGNENDWTIFETPICSHYGVYSQVWDNRIQTNNKDSWKDWHERFPEYDLEAVKRLSGNRTW